MSTNLKTTEHLSWYWLHCQSCDNWRWDNQWELPSASQHSHETWRTPDMPKRYRHCVS